MARFERQGRLAIGAGPAPKGRCFIATLAFGDGWQTQALQGYGAAAAPLGAVDRLPLLPRRIRHFRGARVISTTPQLRAMACRSGSPAVEVVVGARNRMITLETASAALILGIALGSVGWALIRRRAAAVERSQRPARLRDAQLVFVEKQFRSSGRWPVVARVDRVYRMPSGIFVLVELKTRASPMVTQSDVIQLSAQRIALEDAVGGTVSDEAYVLVPRRRQSHSLVPLDVKLLPRQEVEHIA